jgi:hypothetical protein
MWVRGLADAEKIDVLVRLVPDDDAHHLHAELVQRVLQATEFEQLLGPPGGRRTVKQLLAAAALPREARERAAAERAQGERQRQDRQRAAARATYLDTLVGRVEDEWQRVEARRAKKVSLLERLEKARLLRETGERRRRLAVSETLSCSVGCSRARCGGSD